jgi:uncharacterized FlaG/YvyC family protein
MSDQLIAQVGNTHADMATRIIQQSQAASASTVQESTQTVDKGQAVRRVEESEENKSKQPKSESQNTGAKSVDVFLKFQVDDQTDQLTIFVLDRSTKKVIRTIPAEELSKMSAGQLVELFI